MKKSGYKQYDRSATENSISPTIL